MSGDSVFRRVVQSGKTTWPAHVPTWTAHAPPTRTAPGPSSWTAHAHSSRFARQPLVLRQLLCCRIVRKSSRENSPTLCERIWLTVSFAPLNCPCWRTTNPDAAKAARRRCPSTSASSRSRSFLTGLAEFTRLPAILLILKSCLNFNCKARRLGRRSARR